MTRAEDNGSIAIVQVACEGFVCFYIVHLQYKGWRTLVLAFLGFVVALVPMPWHFQAWNSGTCVYMLWASLSCLIQFVDSLVWHNNMNVIAPVYCDITTKFLIGAGVGIPAASLCINRRLYTIASTQVASITRREKRNAVLVDLAIAVGIPVIVMILHYIVQGHRFNILEDVGCTPTIFNTIAAYPLVYMWPVLLGCVSFVYAALTIRAFLIRRAQFKQILASSSSLTISRYFRLLLLASVDMACTVPLTAYSIYINNDGVTLEPWVSWSNVHYNFSFVEQIPALVWRSNHAFLISVELGRWIYPCCAIIFFLLFGFAEEARRHYRMAFSAIAKRIDRSRMCNIWISSLRLGFKRGGDRPSSDTLPAYIPPTPVRRKRPESLSSSLAESVVNIDLEKTMPSSSSSFTLPYDRIPSSYDPKASLQTNHGVIGTGKSSDNDDPVPRIEISEAHPASRPASPCAASFANPVPSFHRPFTPPTVCPVPPSRASSQALGGSIQVTVHTEAINLG